MIFKHLLPKAKAWSITVDKQLRQFFTGLQVALVDAIQTFFDEIWADMDPQKTRELGLFENQFALPDTLLTEQQRRDRLDATWKALGGQSPRYIQDTLQAAGFDVYVHDWWEPSSEPAVNVKACVTPRNPFDYLNDGATLLQYISVDGGSDMQDGDIMLPFDVSGETLLPSGIFFKPDGTKMYVIGTVNPGSLGYVFEYDLACPWSVVNAVYNGVFMDFNESVTGNGLFFKPDGTKLYIVYDYGTGGYVEEYDLPTPWTLTDFNYVTDFVPDSQDISMQGVFFKPDGTKMYLIGNISDSVHQYTLSPAWSLATASYDSVSVSVSAENVGPQSVFFKDDGTKMYMVGLATSSEIFQYSLPTPWVLTGATYDSISFDVDSQDTSAQGLFIKDNGNKLFMIGDSTDSIYQYHISASWDLTDVYNDTLAMDGLTNCQPTGYPLVNCVFIYLPGFIGDGSLDMQDNEALAMDGAFATGSQYEKRDYVIPIDPLKYPYFLYIGGSTFPVSVNIPLSRRTEFETLCLKIRPAHLWLGMLVDYS